MVRDVLADGLRFPEGPVRLGPERVAFTEIRGQRISLWDRGKVSLVAHTGGGPNGATFGPDGALYVANNGGLSFGPEGRWLAPEGENGRIQRVTFAGAVTDVAVDLPGVRPNRPNDLCFGPDGLLYYTAGPGGLGSASDLGGYDNFPRLSLYSPRAGGGEARCLAHAANGVVRVAVDGDAAVRAVVTGLRGELRAAGGGVVVERASAAARAGLEVWGDPGAGRALMQRLKAAFDPSGILAPGRFVAGL